MLSNDVKENMIVGIIMASKAEPETKKELINYVRCHNSKAIQAAFNLGQMDMRMSAAAAIVDTAPCGEGDCRTCTMETACLVKSLGVI